MVAERAVQQGLLDLRGELGAKLQEIDSGLKGLQSLHSQITEMDENFENLNDNITAAFKNNNALLRNEIKAVSGDTAQKSKDENAANVEQMLRTQNEKLQKQMLLMAKSKNLLPVN
mgnify:CR=1 FL=1